MPSQHLTGDTEAVGPSQVQFWLYREGVDIRIGQTEMQGEAERPGVMEKMERWKEREKGGSVVCSLR